MDDKKLKDFDNVSCHCNEFVEENIFEQADVSYVYSYKQKKFIIDDINPLEKYARCPNCGGLLRAIDSDKLNRASLTTRKIVTRYNNIEIVESYQI